MPLFCFYTVNCVSVWVGSAEVDVKGGYFRAEGGERMTDEAIGGSC